MNIKPLLNQIQQLKANLAYFRQDSERWRKAYEEANQQRHEISIHLGTVSMLYHVCTITPEMYERYKSQGCLVIDPETGNYTALLVPQGPDAKRKMGL